MITTDPTITLVRGDTLDANKASWTWRHNGVVQDITSGWSARLVIMDGDTEVLDVDTAGAAGARLQILASKKVVPDVGSVLTAEFPVGSLLYDVELTNDSTGERVTIVNAGRINIRKDLAT